MSSWFQYEASKLAHEEQQIRERGRTYHAPARPAGRLSAWVRALLARSGWAGPARRSPHTLSAHELRCAADDYRLN